jgi:hypothetical protein
MAGRKQRFVLCIRSGSYEESLQPRKVYRVLADPKAADDSLVRIVDDTGEDYLFPADLFVPIDVPATAARVFRQTPAHTR